MFLPRLLLRGNTEFLHVQVAAARVAVQLALGGSSVALLLAVRAARAAAPAPWALAFFAQVFTLETSHF